jgi:hypothetical protein
MSPVKPEKADRALHMSAADLLAKFQKSPEYARLQSKVPAPAPTRAAPATSGATVAGTFCLEKKPGESTEQAIANAVLVPPNLAATSLHQWQHGFVGTGNEVDINQLLTGLVEQIKQACDGNLGGVKSRLLMQASVLDAIFFKLNVEAARNIGKGGSLDLSERLLKLAFRAQSQSRATDETLAFLEHPKALFIRQQNNAAGHQQVVNSRARKEKPGTNKLMEKTHEERLDSSAAGTPVCRDPSMAAVDAFDWPANDRGKGNGCAKRLPRGRH